MTAVSATRTVRVLDVGALRAELPALDQQIHGKPLTYLDSAASALKPRAVIDAVTSYYLREGANVHRGVHTLSQRATKRYEDARKTAQRFLGAASETEIVFVRQATEGLNLVAQSYGRSRVGPGDNLVLTQLEHHSNIVPWQLLAEEKGAELRVVPIDDRGDLVLHEFERLIDSRTRVVAVAHASNALGTLNPVAEIAALAHRKGAVVVVDGAQAVPHVPVDVVELGADFYALSGHKLYGPTGIGVLYGRSELLDAMPPWQGGGGMIRSVSFQGTTFAPPPERFEAGTPHVSGAIGLARAMEWLEALGWEAIQAHEEDVLGYAESRLQSIPSLRLIGTPRRRVAAISFVMEAAHPHDIGTIIDMAGIAVRAGHHCAQPVMERFGVPATVRASFAVFNTRADVDRLVDGLREVGRIFAG
jgi:cysteine desulfurase/selenocysteine lyase